MKIDEIHPRPHLYLDMDGVLADFFTAWARLHGKERYKEIGDRPAREASIQELNARGPEFVQEFFRNLSPLSGGIELVNWLNRNHIPFTILSAPLKGNEDASIAGKRQWLDQHIPGAADSAKFTREKYQYARQNGRSNVLVDDFKTYVGEWRAAGGRAILYRDSRVQDVIRELADIYIANDHGSGITTLTESGYISRRLIANLRNQGYIPLGRGVDQMAFHTPDRTAVLKIFSGAWQKKGEIYVSGDQKMALFWADYCANHRSNPFLPKFGRGRSGRAWEPFEFGQYRYLRVIQEYLGYDRTIGIIMSNLTDYLDLLSPKKLRLIITGQKPPETWGLIQVIRNARTILRPAQLLRFFDTAAELYVIGEKKGWRWDLHQENIRVRQGRTPVIVDPWVT